MRIFENMSFHWFCSLQRFDYYSDVCLFGGTATRLLAAARAPGVKATLLTPEFFPGWALVLLPSKQFKVYSNVDVSAQAGFVQVHAREKVALSKAGRAVNMGHKPQTRGTVKNAKDHPNGGRARALRLSRTPWGVPTKKSRLPRRFRLVS